jgi:uncharacterized protein (TIGR03437 family)
LSPARAACRVTIGGKEGKVYFAGLTPGFIGLAQVNVQVPEFPAGDYQMVVEIGGAASQPVLLAVM